MKIIAVGIFFCYSIKIFFTVHFLFKWRQNLSARPRTFSPLKTRDKTSDHFETKCSITYISFLKVCILDHLKPRGHFLCHQMVLHHVKLTNCTFCPHSAFVCFGRISENTTLTYCFCNRDGNCLLRGTNWVFKQNILLTYCFRNRDGECLLRSTNWVFKQNIVLSLTLLNWRRVLVTY